MARSEFADGEINDVLAYECVLTDAEVAALFVGSI